MGTSTKAPTESRSDALAAELAAVEKEVAALVTGIDQCRAAAVDVVANRAAHAAAQAKVRAARVDLEAKMELLADLREAFRAARQPELAEVLDAFNAAKEEVGEALQRARADDAIRRFEIEARAKYQTGASAGEALAQDFNLLGKLYARVERSAAPGVGVAVLRALPELVRQKCRARAAMLHKGPPSEQAVAEAVLRCIDHAIATEPSTFFRDAMKGHRAAWAARLEELAAHYAEGWRKLEELDGRIGEVTARIPG